jgi:short-subunit dehydrogenase
MPLLDDATILITGASAGLGAEFARQVAPRARCVLLAARRADRLTALAQEIARPGLAVHCLAVDLASAEDTARFVAEVRALGVNVNVLINNAGLGDHGLFEDSDWPRVAAMIDVNVTALTRITHAFVQDLIASGDAGILNVSSIASLLPLPQMAVYAATKAYVTSFSEALRAELRGTGVRVLALCPGPVDTEFFIVAERANSDGSQAAPALMKVPAAQVVREGLAALEGDRARVIPGWLVFGVMMAAVATPMFVKRFFLNRRGRGFTGH